MKKVCLLHFLKTSMKKLLVTATFALAGLSGVVNAQQDPQFTQWMFNRLIYNPGYAGTSGTDGRDDQHGEQLDADHADRGR